MGHSTLKHNKPIMLVDACWEDTCTMILQEKELSQFLSGYGRSCGKGLTTNAIARTEKRKQEKRAKDYSQQFKQGNLMFCEDEEIVFIPSKKAKHKPPDNYKRNRLEGVVDTSSFTTATRLLTEGVSLGQASTSTGGLTTQQDENPPLLCFLQGLNIKMCYGCKKKFDQKLRNPPIT